MRQMTFWHPASLVATCFGAGLLPRAPGTWGSLASLPAAAFLAWSTGPGGLFIGAVVVTLLGWWAIPIYLADSKEHDPGRVVVDEVAGQFLALIPAGLNPWLYLAGFVLFRLFDVRKPWPVSWANDHVHGPSGVLLDDILAGVYAAVGVGLLGWWMEN